MLVLSANLARRRTSSQELPYIIPNLFALAPPAQMRRYALPSYLSRLDPCAPLAMSMMNTIRRDSSMT